MLPSYIFLLLLSLFVVVMFLVEIFFIPGFGLFGIIGGVVSVAVGYYLFSTMTWEMGFFFAGASVVLFFIGFYFFSKSRWVDRVSLRTTINDKVNKLPPEVSLATECTAESRLAPIGKVRIGQLLFEAVSESGFVEEGTPLVISRVENDKIYVKKQMERNKHL